MLAGVTAVLFCGGNTHENLSILEQIPLHRLMGKTGVCTQMAACVTNTTKGHYRRQLSVF